MKKILLLLLLFLPLNVLAIELPNTNSEKVLIYDLTEDKVLLSKKSAEVSSIASLTKLMTVLVGIENIDNLDEEITITSEMIAGVPWDASIAKLSVGSVITYRDLLHAIMLPSGADAAYAIARTTTGSLDNFVKLMNEKADELGMLNTEYKNVTGLDAKGHVSTIDDTLTLLKYALENEEFYKIYTTQEYIMKNDQKLESTVYGYSQVLNRDISRIMGAKTGFTDQAGTCISALFEAHEHMFIVITLAAPPEPKKAYHINDALDLIEFIDYNYQNQILVNENTLIKEIPVILSKIDTYNIESNMKVTKFLPNDYDKSLIRIEYSGEEKLSYKSTKGMRLGTISYYYSDELLFKEDVVLEKNIELDIIKLLDKHKKEIIIGVISVILFIIIMYKLNKHKS